MISTEIRLNNHNSYNITSALFSYPFGVAGYEYITHSFQTFATSPLTSEIRAKTKFFNDSGVLISETNHTFPVYGVFDKVELPVEVPIGAFQAQLVFLKGTTSWWVVEPKSEDGQTATPFNTNIQSQLTFITQAGIYTGMVNAQQIVVSGTIENPDETLETRLVTINNNAINVSATVSTYDTRITTIEAGQITLTNTVNNKVGIGVDYKGVTIDATNGFTSTATVGGKTIVTKANSIDGLSIYNGSIKVFGVDTGGRVFATSVSNVNDSSYYMTYGYGGSPGLECFFPMGGTPTKFMGISPDIDGGIQIFDKNNVLRIYLDAINGLMGIRDHNGNTRENFLPDGGIELVDTSGQQVFMASGGSSTSVELICKVNNSMRIGVDSTGPYYVKNSSKNYFPGKFPQQQVGIVHSVSSSESKVVTFPIPFPTGSAVRVFATPTTTQTGVIVPKVFNESPTGFSVVIGGSGFSNISVNWTAIVEEGGALG